MYSSLWNEAQGRHIWNDNWPKRCDLCGRRVEFSDFVSVFVGRTDTAVVIHKVCHQHGSQYVDCLKGIEVDFGKGRNWSAIWASNLLNEMIFWLKSVICLAWFSLEFMLHVVIHPVRYYHHRQGMRKWRIG